jgi:predicted ATPase
MGKPIDRITLKGFKSIKDLDSFPLRSLNVLIGANGAGKSNFIDFFRLLRAMVDNNLAGFVKEHGGADSFFFMGPKYTRRISARLEFGQNAYEFVLAPTSSSELMFEGQQIHYAGGSKAGGATYSAGGGVHEPAFKMPYDQESELGKFQAKLLDGLGLNIHESVSAWIVYHFHDTSMLAPMRRIGSVRDNEYLRPDAGNLAAFLLMLHDQHQNTYEKIRDTVRLAAPFFDDFKLRPQPSKADTLIQLEWTQKGSDYPFHASQLSDGTLRFVALTTALLQPNPPTTILIDEPELGLHPYALNLFAGLAKSAAARTQVIVSTQSAPLLDNFEAEDVIVVERKDGASTFERLSSAKLAEWLKDYSLGELWQKNVIGGRPADG